MTRNNKEKLTGAESREELDMFIEYNLKMMTFSGALASASRAENGWWCIQFPSSDHRLIPYECAMMLAVGFRYGIEHYHDYRRAQRDLAVCLAEVDAERAKR